MIEKIDDLFYYYDLLDSGDVDEGSIELALSDFISHFDIETSYNDSLDRLHGHVDSDIATAIIKFQEFVNITYKVVKYQDRDVTLSEDELRSIKVYIKVENGSSKLKWAKAIAKIFNKVTEGMSPKQKIIFATLIASVVTGGFVINNVAERYIDSTERVQLSQQETQRQENIINGFNKVQREVDSNVIYKTIDNEGKKAILDPVKKNDGVTYNVVTNPEEEDEEKQIKTTINQEKVKEILKTTRSRSETDVLTTLFKVNGVLNSSEQGKVVDNTYSILDNNRNVNIYSYNIWNHKDINA